MTNEKAPTHNNEQRLYLDLRNINFSTAENTEKSSMGYRDFLIDKHASKAGLRGKIDAQCIECIHDPYQLGSWRKQVENCTSYAGPLYSVGARFGGA